MINIKHFYTSKEVQQMLGCTTLRTAQLRIQAMNEELKVNGYWVERGKVPISFFHEKYPYIKRVESNENQHPRMSKDVGSNVKSLGKGVSADGQR